MQVGKIDSGLKIGFAQNNHPVILENSQPENTQKKQNPVTKLPAKFVNVNTPIKYSKINEFTLPGTDTKVHIYKLANGQTVVLAPKKGSTQINTYVDCGSLNETEDKRGISHYIEHNLFNGSKNINPKEFFNLVNSIGAYTNAWTSEFATSYMIISHLFDDEDLKKIIELHSDMVQYPKFEQSQLDKEKGVVNSEITMYDDNNYRIMTGKALKQLFQIDSEANDIVGGTVSNINNLKREDVINYYNKNYTPDKMITVLTGEFDPKTAIDLISKNFTKIAISTQNQYNVELKPIDKSKRIDYYSTNINGDEFLLAFSGPKNSDLKDILALKMALNILSGEKYSKLDMALKSYNINPQSVLGKISNKKDNPQYIELSGSCNPKDTETVLNKVFETIHKAKYENLSEEVEIIKKQTLKNFQYIFETGNSINMFLGDSLRDYTPEQIQKMPEIIKSITQDDIKSVMEKYLDLNKVSLVVSHPLNKENKLSFKGKLEKKGQDLSEFKYIQLQNNAQIYLKDDKSDLKEFIMQLKTSYPANVSPELKDVLTKILDRGLNGIKEEDFKKDLSKHASKIYISAGNDSISIEGNALKEDINYVLNKAIEVLNNPQFNQKTLDDVKKQIEKDIIEEQKFPEDYLVEVMYPQLKSASTKEEKLKSLNNITLGDVIGLMQYIKQNSTLYFGWNKEEVPFILNSLGMYKTVMKTDLNTYKPLEKDVLKVQSEESGQAKIIQAYKFEQSKNPEEIAKLKVLNSILGGQQSSRLFTDLRESQKLAYSVHSNLEVFGNTGLIVLSIGTTTDNPQDKSATSENIIKSLNGFKNNIEKIKSEPITEEELNTAKLNLKSGILNRLERNSDKITLAIDNVAEEKDIDYTNKIMKAIDNVTIEDVQKTAQKVFAGHNLTSIVASEKTIKELNLQQGD